MIILWLILIQSSTYRNYLLLTYFQFISHAFQEILWDSVGVFLLHLLLIMLRLLLLIPMMVTVEVWLNLWKQLLSKTTANKSSAPMTTPSFWLDLVTLSTLDKLTENLSKLYSICNMFYRIAKIVSTFSQYSVLFVSQRLVVIIVVLSYQENRKVHHRSNVANTAKVCSKTCLN